MGDDRGRDTRNVLLFLVIALLSIVVVFFVVGYIIGNAVI